MQLSHLLMIEDDARLAVMVGEYLERSGYSFEHAAEGGEGLRRVQQRLPDLVILDLLLPGADGLELCRQLRALPGAAGRVPVIMLTAKGDPMDRIVGLEMGADDYLPKPFEPRELLARIRAILRRHNGVPAETATTVRPLMRFGSLEIDRDARTVTVAGEPCDITSHQFDLLVVLAAEECARTGASLEVSGEAAGRLLVGYPRLVRRLLRNLLENAKRHTASPSAEPVVCRIGTGDRQAGRMRWQVEVCDRGPGVPDAFKSRIFEPFFRLPGSSERDGGVGLGLARVRAIARRHGGEVTSRDRTGGGAVFEVSLQSVVA